MKKTTLLSLVFAILFFPTLYSQDFSENFDSYDPSDINDLPLGWTFYATGSHSGFELADFESVSGPNSLSHPSFNSTSQVSWVVFPGLIVSSGSQLSFEHFQDLFFGQVSVEVLISTVSNDPSTNPGDFTVLDEIGTSASDSTWSTYMKDLSAYAGQVVFIGIRYNGDNGQDFYIDNVEVSNSVLSSGRNELDKNIKVYPTVTNSFVTVKALETINNVQVFNLLGRLLYNGNPNTIETQLDLANFPTGMYIVKAQVGDAIGSYRIVKK